MSMYYIKAEENGDTQRRFLHRLLLQSPQHRKFECIEYRSHLTPNNVLFHIRVNTCSGGEFTRRSKLCELSELVVQRHLIHQREYTCLYVFIVAITLPSALPRSLSLTGENGDA